MWQDYRGNTDNDDDPLHVVRKAVLHLDNVMQSQHPKYCLKMATGTGKTWVLQALLYWQLLNAAREPNDKRFTRNFLLVAPGLRYVKENGLPGFYSPDFLVRTEEGIWLVETKAQNQLTQPDVIRKKTAAVAWCDRVNELSPEHRSERRWSYCLLGETLFKEFRDKGASMVEVLRFSRFRAMTAESFFA